MADEPPACTAEWMLLPPRRVLLADVVPSHDTNPDFVASKHRCWWRSHSGDIYSHGVRLPDGRVALLDGHHRVRRELDLGRRWTWMRVWEPNRES